MSPRAAPVALGGTRLAAQLDPSTLAPKFVTVPFNVPQTRSADRVNPNQVNPEINRGGLPLPPVRLYGSAVSSTLASPKASVSSPVVAMATPRAENGVGA